MIGFKASGDHISFEINQNVAEHNKIKIRSKLLRLARRVIDE